MNKMRIGKFQYKMKLTKKTTTGRYIKSWMTGIVTRAPAPVKGKNKRFNGIVLPHISIGQLVVDLSTA